MSFVLKRILTYATVASYVVVGTAAVRFYAPIESEITLNTDYFSLLSETHVKSSTLEMATPELAFSKIELPVEKTASAVAQAYTISTPVRKIASKVPATTKPSGMRAYVVTARYKLPFNEPIKLASVQLEEILPKDLMAFYKTAPGTPEETRSDTVSTKLAQSEPSSDSDPSFFEYPVEDSQVVSTEQSEAVDKVAVDVEKAVDNSSEVVNTDELVAFDYAAAERDLVEQKIPTYSSLTTQGSVKGTQKIGNISALGSGKSSSPQFVNPGAGKLASQARQEEKGQITGLTIQNYPVQMTIQATATNLSKTAKVKGFEVRFHDDSTEIKEDFGAGSVTIKDELSTSKATRSTTILKRGYAPTNTDLILEEGVSEVLIPLIEEKTFNNIMTPYSKKTSIGAVLVELDDESEYAELDAPYGKTVKLDGDLKITKANDFRYQLFVGVRAGNVLLSYKTMKGEIVSKIIHVNEHELTFETNFFEKVSNESITLVEEDLLAKEDSPLIISSEQVKQFSSPKTSIKVSENTYKMDFNKILLGGRKYLELLHQDEPIYVGLRDKQKVSVPSESFMRHILSRLEGAKLGNRCLVQINLGKKAEKVLVDAESNASTLMTRTQVLDTDGKFYDSVGEKSEKIIIVGESQGSSELGQDGKINVKIRFQDGSNQYLNTYCVPNSYFVEQL